MIVNERIVSYIHSLEKSNSVVLEEIEKEAIATYVPIIRKEMESFLRVMLLMKRPKRILELGTAVGYSAILMSEYMPKDCVIDTIENYEKRIPIAKANFEKAGVADRINLYEGDAMEIMPKLEHKYDFVFMDAAKAQYIYFLPLINDLMEEGGILITDNVLQDGDIIESRFGVTRRNRTIHSRMREYMYEIKNSSDFETSIVPIGDGITLSIKKEKSDV